MVSKTKSINMLLKIRNDVGLLAQLVGVTKVASRYNVSRGFVRYWKKKIKTPSFHSGELGGEETISLALIWGLRSILDVRKMEKYTAKNIAKYIIHILYASKIPIQKLKFMDESGMFIIKWEEEKALGQ